MTTSRSTCTKPHGTSGDVCGGEILPSYIGTVLGDPRQPMGDGVHPARCQRCDTEYVDVVHVPLTAADLGAIGDRLSEHARQRLNVAGASEDAAGCYSVAMIENEARDMAAKIRNLGLAAIADKIREQLNDLTSRRRREKTRHNGAAGA